MTKTNPKQENMFLNLIFNLMAPIMILTKLSGEDRLGPTIALIVAIALPLGYGIYDYATRRTFNFLSGLGLANVLITGVIGLMELDGFWIAVKEATIPALIGVFVLASMRSKRPLVRTFLYSDQIFDTEKIESTLEQNGNQTAFSKLIDKTTYVLAFSFLCSAILNFILAKAIVTSAGGTEEFNQQIGKMNALSWVVIVIPTMVITGYALWLLFGGIKRLTGLTMEESMRTK
ncbi:hypothetical protein MLD52_20115 [Puniceicoccaceae bacterium K14]|nr:hypothetical protein [Puniceicoccaceae bacterium K14]